jgi:hypothetical protein
MRRTIGGSLTLEALARLHRPTNRDTLRAAAVEMRSRGMSLRDIAVSLGIHESEVARLVTEPRHLNPHQPSNEGPSTMNMTSDQSPPFEVTPDTQVSFPDGGPGQPVQDIALDEATRQYEALINDRPYIPRALEDSLLSARQRKAAADRLLSAADDDVARKRDIEADYATRLEAAQAAIAGNDDLEAARDLSEARRIAEAQLTAARNMARKSLDAQALAWAQRAAADEAVLTAARSILHAHVRAKFETWKQQHAQVLQLRECLLGACLSDARDALTPREWFELEKRRGFFSAQELEVGLPLFTTYQDEADPFDFGDPRGARARVNAQTADWQGRLTELVSGNTAISPSEEAAA